MADNNPNHVNLDGAQDSMVNEPAPDKGYRDLSQQIWAYHPQPPVHPGAFKLEPQVVQSDPTGD